MAEITDINYSYTIYKVTIKILKSVRPEYSLKKNVSKDTNSFYNKKIAPESIKESGAIIFFRRSFYQEELFLPYEPLLRPPLEEPYLLSPPLRPLLEEEPP